MGIKIVELEGIFPDDLVKIYDFGTNQNAQEYYSLSTEYLLIEDKEAIHVMKGNESTWGLKFETFMKYTKNDQPEKYLDVIAIHDMVIVETYKVVAIIDKHNEHNNEIETVVEIFEFNIENEEFKMVRPFEVVPNQLESLKASFRKSIIYDHYNNMFYINLYQSNEEKLTVLTINNDVSNKAEEIQLNPAIAMNIVANNLDFNNLKPQPDKKTKRTRGLLFHDFCSSD